MAEEDSPAIEHRVARSTIILRWAVGLVLLAAVIFGGWYAYIYAQSPAAIRHPTRDHFHLRTQVIVGGKAVNFAEAQYQTKLTSDVCTASLTKQPFHFHDNEDQFTHVHWQNMTGGLFLKNYGWNFVDGLPDKLGYKIDSPFKFSAVPIHGKVLPAVPAGSRYYVFIGDAGGYREASWSSYLRKDLRSFFKIKGVATVSRHEDHNLVKLNDVVGSVVIFAQADRPSPAQVTDRFKHLTELPESSCAG